MSPKSLQVRTIPLIKQQMPRQVHRKPLQQQPLAAKKLPNQYTEDLVGNIQKSSEYYKDSNSDKGEQDAGQQLEQHEPASPRQVAEMNDILEKMITNIKDIQGTHESLGVGQGFDAEGNVTIESSDSCALNALLAAMKRIHTGDFGPDSMRSIILDFSPKMWPSIITLEHLMDLRRKSGYIGMDDLYPWLWPSNSGFRTTYEEGGSILREETWSKLSNRLSEDDVVSELHIISS